MSKYKRGTGKEWSQKLLPAGPQFQLALQGSLLPFTVTRPITSQEMSVAVESRDVNLVFGKIS